MLRRLFFLVATLFVVHPATYAQTTRLSLNLEQFDEYLRRYPNTVVLDVRPQQMYRQWRLKRASINLPIDSGVPDFFEADARSLLGKNKDVVVVCFIGVLSTEAGNRLRKIGYRAVMLEDGLDALPDRMMKGKKPPRSQLK